MTGAVTDVTLSQLSLSTHQKSKFSGTKSQRQLPTKPWLLLISWSMDKIPAVHLFFIHGTIGLESLMCKVLSRQRVLMKQLLGHRTRVTRVTLRSSPRQDDQNLNLVNSCVGPAETALVSSTCTATAQSFQQGDLVACEASIYWNFLDLRYVWAKATAQAQFCYILLLTDSHQSDTDSIHLASFGKR